MTAGDQINVQVYTDQPWGSMSINFTPTGGSEVLGVLGYLGGQPISWNLIDMNYLAPSDGQISIRFELPNPPQQSSGFPTYYDDLSISITSSSGIEVVQRDDYYPFGGTFNSYAQAPENLYKFTGKEEQKETGLYDFGARMLDPWLGRWNRIDNKADEYTAISPYAYVANNPIMMIDPDGNDIVIIGDARYRAMVRNQIMNLAQTPEGARLVESLRNSEHITVIHYGGKNNNLRHASGKTVTGKNASWVYFDPESQGTVDGVKRTPVTSLSHELRHAEQDFDGTGQPRNEHGIMTEDYDMYTDANGNSTRVVEVDAVNNSENPVRASLGLSIRESYGKVGTVNVVINGKEITVGKNDYASVKGPAATKAFQQLMGQILTGNVNMTSLVDQFAKYDKFRKNKKSDETKYNNGDAAEIYD